MDSIELRNKYPKLFRESSRLEIGSGWVPLLEEVCIYLENSNLPIYFTQIKEKFGELRIDFTGKNVSLNGLLEAYDFVEQIQERAKNICELCGRYYPATNWSNGWCQSLCEKCIEQKEIK